MARIAVLMRDLQAGGIQRVMLMLAGEWAAQGHTVDLLLLRPAGNGASGVTLPAGVRGHHLARARRTQALRALLGADALATLVFLRRRLPTAVRVLPALTQWLEHHQPDALLAGSSWLNLGAVWARTASAWQGRVVVSEHNHFTARQAGTPAVSRWLLGWLMRRGYARADAVVAVAQAVLDNLVARRLAPPDHSHVLYNPVRPAAGPHPPPHPWLRDRTVPVVIAAGRLVEAKNHALLIDAFARLRRRRNARLIVLGEGALRDTLLTQIREAGIQDHVTLPGTVDDVYPWFAHASAFALSSRHEGLPLVLIEALACGCPVVSTDCLSGPAEILDGGRYGALVPPGDAAALAAALERVLDHPPSADAGRARAAQFSPQRAARAYLDVLLGDAVPAPARQAA